jgi:hypothetical protein
MFELNLYPTSKNHKDDIKKMLMNIEFFFLVSRLGTKFGFDDNILKQQGH